MKKLLVLLLLGATSSLFGQQIYQPKHRYLEAGVLFGAANYSGDVTEKWVAVAETRLGFGAFVRYFLQKKWALRGHVLAGSISGDDHRADDDDIRMRQIRFSTNLLEISALGEWHPWGKDRFSSIGDYKRFFSPYVSFGAAVTFTDARTEYYGLPEDQDRLLRAPLPEPGLKKTFIIAPLAIGIRADINEGMALGLEAGVRPVFSDDLDGVRLNGNPDRGDWYYFAGATVSFILGKEKTLN
ncbi:MAG: DUF6089 family protein [Saprospiraceae bacterium]|nr:DUF6089 family protein [Saprospiraceae bacterium]